MQTKNASATINILNFVYEKEHHSQQKFLIPASYSLCLVTDGSGCLHTGQGDYALERGYLFFVFTAKPYRVENCGELRYFYISFIGSRVIGLFERLHVLPSAPVYPGYGKLISRWKADMELATEENIDLVCEGLLLHTLSLLCCNPEEKSESGVSSEILRIKQYVDLHYADCGLDLKSVSGMFGYNFKYVSTAFVKLCKKPFSEYLRDLRMNHARILLRSGSASVREVAAACGYSDALYFSKIFKKMFGIAPKNYQKEQRNV